MNSINATELPLFMDSYLPDNNAQNRPLLILIHGDGFAEGTKQQESLAEMANYYAASGFVVFSIDYRPREDTEINSQEWFDYVSDIDLVNPNQTDAIYPAHRAVKAALRSIVSNTEDTL